MAKTSSGGGSKGSGGTGGGSTGAKASGGAASAATTAAPPSTAGDSGVLATIGQQASGGAETGITAGGASLAAFSPLARSSQNESPAGAAVGGEGRTPTGATDEGADGALQQGASGGASSLDAWFDAHVDEAIADTHRENGAQAPAPTNTPAKTPTPTQASTTLAEGETRTSSSTAEQPAQQGSTRGVEFSPELVDAMAICKANGAPSNVIATLAKSDPAQLIAWAREVAPGSGSGDGGKGAANPGAQAPAAPDAAEAVDKMHALLRESVGQESADVYIRGVQERDRAKDATVLTLRAENARLQAQVAFQECAPVVLAEHGRTIADVESLARRTAELRRSTPDRFPTVEAATRAAAAELFTAGKGASTKPVTRTTAGAETPQQQRAGRSAGDWQDNEIDSLLDREAA